jgi:hypothetical protein
MTKTAEILALITLVLIARSAASAASVVLAGSPSPAVFGQPVTLTVPITPGTATGSVEFYDCSAVLAMRLVIQ